MNMLTDLERIMFLLIEKTTQSGGYILFWCPAAESNYELVLTMDPLCRLTSGASRIHIGREEDYRQLPSVFQCFLYNQFTD